MVVYRTQYQKVPNTLCSGIKVVANFLFWYSGGGCTKNGIKHFDTPFGTEVPGARAGAADDDRPTDGPTIDDDRPTIADRRQTIGDRCERPLGDRSSDRSTTAPDNFFNRSGSRGVDQEGSGGLGE